MSDWANDCWAWCVTRWRRLRRRPWANLLMVLLAIVLACAVSVKMSAGDLSKSDWWAVYLALSAAILGLFKDSIFRWVYFPELELLFYNGAPYCDEPPAKGKSAAGVDFSLNTIYFRPLVINHGTARAEKVEVMITDVHRPQPGGPAILDRQFSMNLGWSNLSGVTVLDGINPEMRRFVDLGKIYQPNERVAHLGESENLPDHEGVVFSLSVEVQGNHCPYLLPAKNDWYVTLLLSAANHPTRRYRMTIQMTNDWINAGGMAANLHPETGHARLTLERLR
jgi:hypothetical protein